MKPLFFVILLFFLVLRSHAQELTGKVVDSANSFELKHVEVSNARDSFSILTSSAGVFSVPKAGRYLFSKKGYISKTTDISGDTFSVIALVAIPQDLTEIIITSNNFQSNLKTVPTAISVLSATEIKQNNTVSFAPILNTVPGVYMHNGTYTTSRITIRGIGSRNLFGTSKIRAYYQDIPLTNGSGASTIEDIELSTLGRIEILKGPSSSIYGAGLGGTIQLIPNKGTIAEMSAEGSYSFGSYGFQKQVLQANLGNFKNTGTITFSNLHNDGYRENNKTDRRTVTVATNHFLGDSDQLTFIGNYIDLKAFIPSSIDEDDYVNDPTSAAFTWGRSMGYEDYKKGFFGLSWQHQYNARTKQYTSIFTSFLDSYEPRPFNILNENTNGVGLRSRIISETTLFKKPLNWTFGGELFSDTNSFQTYENLYEEFPPDVGSVQGALLSDLREKRSYYNLFFDSKFSVSEKTAITFGINFNKTVYTLDDAFMSDGNDLSGDYDFSAILSPKFGLTQQVTPNAMLYATISHGFSPPSLEETLLPDGLINNDIKPESGWNYEIGSRGGLFNNKLQYAVSMYKMDVKNLLVARRTASDEFIGVNAGKTRYHGLEIAMNYLLLRSEKLKIAHHTALAFNDFKFREFIDDTDNYSGNDVTGVPKSTINSYLNFETEFGLYAFLNYNYVGEIPIRDDNAVYSEKYQLVHSKFGFKSDESKKFRFDVFVGFNNIFNEKYASMLLINAGSFGTNLPRYYYPGEPTNYFAGAILKYLF